MGLVGCCVDLVGLVGLLVCLLVHLLICWFVFSSFVGLFAVFLFGLLGWLVGLLICWVWLVC